MSTSCPACQNKMTKKIAPWLLYCHSCQLWISHLGEQNNRLKQSSAIIEDNRHSGLKDLRMKNFQEIFKVLESYMNLSGAKICDIGCSYGWFIEFASTKGLKAVGIEPEESVAKVGIKRGLDIRVGYFPECMVSTDNFDIISFNDSLEHLTDINQILDSSHSLLVPAGKLLINIPTSQGFFFKLSLFLYKLGYKTPFNRMWQKGYSSPHLIYFNSQNLEKYVTHHGFKLLHSQSLKSIKLSGLWQRLRMDKNSSFIASIITYCSLILIYPFLRNTEPDILLQIYEKC